MKRFLLSLALFAAPSFAQAMVGGAPAADDGLARAIVTVVGSRGNFCTGALIAPDIVLTAAHCVAADPAAKIVGYDARRQPRLLDVRRVATHPQYDSRGIARHHAGADVALMQLTGPMPAKSPAPFGSPREPIAPGARYTVAGIGVTTPGDGKSGGTVRTATLATTGRPGSLQIRLVDPTTNNARNGLGACTGDSGAPAFETQDGRAVIVGVVSWSTAAGNAAGCGGLTGVTPLTRYRDWIARTAQSWQGR